MMAAELPEKVEFGLVTRTLVNLLMRFCGKLIPNMRYGLGEEYSADGKYEVPHIAFPMFRTMDRVVITPDGEEVPTLGKELPESDADRNARRSGKSSGDNLKFEFGYTYSFSFHSMYIDFANWAITNFPGYKSIDLKSILATQPVSVVVYDIPVDAEGKSVRPFMCNKSYIAYFDFCHISIMSEHELNEYYNSMNSASVEDEEPPDMPETAAAAVEPIDASFPSSAEDDTAAATPTADAALESPRDAGRELGLAGALDVAAVGAANKEESSGTDYEDEALADVPSNTFLPVTLLHDDPSSSLPPSLMPSESRRQPWAPSDGAVWPGIGGTNSFAVVRDFQDVQCLKFVKLNSTAAAPARKSSMIGWSSSKKKTKSSTVAAVGDATAQDMFWKKQSAQKSKADKLRNGDIVHIQSATTGDNCQYSMHKLYMIRLGFCASALLYCLGEYLVVQRGWWLVWTSREPHDKKGQFILTITDYDGGIKAGNSPLYVGFTFRLRSARWPTWQVRIVIQRRSPFR
jgi:hypothetical protein